jgi:hypothetical protein
VRFKYGIHTIFLFVDALAPFSAITEELLIALRERYPDGLIKSNSAPEEKTPIPDSANVVYGVPRVPTDPSRGWKALKLGEDSSSTPTKCGLKDNSIVAFAFEGDDDEGDDGEEEDTVFTVEWPQEDEELYDERA